MSEIPDPFQALLKLNEEVKQRHKKYNESDSTYIYKHRPEEENLNEFEPRHVPPQSKLSVAKFDLKLAEGATEVANRNFKMSEEKRKLNIQELLELGKKALMVDDELQEGKAETERLKRGECSHFKEVALLLLEKEKEVALLLIEKEKEVALRLLEKETEKQKTKILQCAIKEFQEEAIKRGQAFRQAKLDTETRHRKELGQLAANLEATTTKAEQASTDLQKIKQGSAKALAKLNAKLAKNTAALKEKEQELSIATEVLATKVSDFESTSKALPEIQKSHSNCSKTIKSLEIDLRDAKAINNASRTSTHAEADRLKKGIAKATVDLEARLNELEYNDQGLERRCRMFEDRYSQQVIASAKKEEQLIRSVVDERRSHDRVLELQRDLEKEENRFFEVELAFRDLQHQFGVDQE
ncbi:hypothetical protein BTUL_0087g00050 [Botrytis tulipae]|uniref:Uncharacterized protein n=1 Tax=Botrytis tulipae TaxID=87230 RepID=A0A4Z1EP28_9HELO|nr:hypothetical protein BTUL_0087g00050 [Botrytis tulipae]